MDDCIFCRIIRGEVPKAAVFEDEKVLALIPLGYVNKGHVLVMPKRHAETVMDADDEDLKACTLAIKRISSAVMEYTGCEGLNIHQNNYKIAGQEVPHLHFHIIPRFSGDGRMMWNLKDSYGDGEMDEIAEGIKGRLR